ncbi:MAG: hypothetical protein IJ594_02060 [Oscillospiraceae bacterium]|nr:hypothetical protein [Oscillospiraceae bacterium]
MKKWKVLTPLALAAAGAAAAGVYTLLKKEPQESGGVSPAPAAAPKNQKTGSYSFISGYKDAATVDVSLDYDADKYDFAVISEEFLIYTSDSHAAVLRGEDFSFQLEYAGYYQGEGFEDLIRQVSEKYQDFAPVAYGENTGVQYAAGDNICFCFPAGSDPYSYLLLTLFKGPGYDDPIDTLPAHPDFAAILRSMRVNVRR